MVKPIHYLVRLWRDEFHVKPLLSKGVNCLILAKIVLKEVSSFVVRQSPVLDLGLAPSPFVLHIQFNLVPNLTFSAHDRHPLLFNHLLIPGEPNMLNSGSTYGFPPFGWDVGL